MVMLQLLSMPVLAAVSSARVSVQVPLAALAIEPREPVRAFRLLLHAADHGVRIDGYARLIIQGQAHCRLGAAADVGEEDHLVAPRRLEHHIQIQHIGVGQGDGHVQVGDPAAAFRCGDGGCAGCIIADDERGVVGVGGAGAGWGGGREDAGAQAVGAAWLRL